MIQSGGIVIFDDYEWDMVPDDRVRRGSRGPPQRILVSDPSKRHLAENRILSREISQSFRDAFVDHARPANQLRFDVGSVRERRCRNEKVCARKVEFANGFNSGSTVQSRREKYSTSGFRNYVLLCRVPPRQEGRMRYRHDT
jgi:hypothetical protein